MQPLYRRVQLWGKQVGVAIGRVPFQPAESGPAIRSRLPRSTGLGRMGDSRLRL